MVCLTLLLVHKNYQCRLVTRMYHKFLDGWDEKRAQRGEANKLVSDFKLDAHLAFTNGRNAVSLEDFCRLADVARNDPSFFDPPEARVSDFERFEGGVRFSSDLETGDAENDTVWAKVTESGSRDRALVIFHHWNAKSRQSQIAKYFSRRGITVVEASMPYHFERQRIGSLHADYMLSPNLGRTIQSVRQAVLDGRKLLRWLKGEGYGEISVLGLSLGSWIAGLLAAHDDNVSKASLLLSAGSLAEMVWTGRATRSIRASLEGQIALGELDRAWGPLNLENYCERLARPDLSLQVVLAKRDTVVLPTLSERFIGDLAASGVDVDCLKLNCGHYSLALPPHALLAGFRISRFL